MGGDVADSDRMEKLFAEITDRFGGIDVVVNTVGIMLLGPVAGFDLDAFDRMHRTNVRGTFVVSGLAARDPNPGGALINFSSSVIRLPAPGYAAYAATKGAVEAMTLILARELRGRDVTVNAVAPGDRDPAVPRRQRHAAINTLARMSPLERLGRPADIAETVAFLAGPARWIDGRVLYVNGGVA